MIRRFIYGIILISLPMFSLANNKADDLFKQGNEQYSKGNYKAAVQLYQDILNQGYQSTAAYFNLGNAYYKLGEIPSALLYYEKAHKLTPGDADINFNIQLCNLKTTDKIEAAPQFFLSKWWDSIVLGFSISTLAVLSIVFFILGFAVLSYYLFAVSVSLKKATFFAALSLLVVGLFIVLLAADQSHYFASHHQAIVFNNSVTVKSEPGQASKDLFVIHDGTKVDVLEDENGWQRIRLANGNEGWIKASDSKSI
jgi:tetratricopeptide (TPR) repeat protein